MRLGGGLRGRGGHFGRRIEVERRKKVLIKKNAPNTVTLDFTMFVQLILALFSVIYDDACLTLVDKILIMTQKFGTK